jgi:hypothetical protein
MNAFCILFAPFFEQTPLFFLWRCAVRPRCDSRSLSLAAQTLIRCSSVRILLVHIPHHHYDPQQQSSSLFGIWCLNSQSLFMRQSMLPKWYLFVSQITHFVAPIRQYFLSPEMTFALSFCLSLSLSH